MTDTKLHDWKRYWVPRDGKMSLDYDGFLLNPDDRSLLYHPNETEAVGFDALREVPCLVLLGEPGMGKSSALDEAVTRAKAAAGGLTARVLKQDLAAYSTDSYLIEKVFRSHEFKDWRGGNCDLHLFLDSLDECRVSVGSVAKLLAAELRDLKSVERLFLRITCRTAEWPEDLTKCLEKKWPEGATRVLELAPLTRAQVELAATAAGQDPTAFARAVIEKDLVGFARSPLTLRFLLEAWRKEGGSLPISLQELYEEGCHELCSDPRDRSIDPRRDAVPIRHRLLVASHIAAASIFGGRTAIWMDSSNVGRPDGTLSISDLAQGSVTAGQAQVEVTGIQLRVVLDSGLFSSRGENLMGWAHQTYAEFLAARYFRNESLTPAQILDLLTSPMDSDKKLVPQLQETAAWASEPNSPLFNHLSQVQPDALLGSDVATASPEVKAALLKAILDAFIRDDVSADWWTLRRRWPKLSHPGIDSTLRSVLKDRDGPALPRAIAIEIAMACKVGALAPLLTEIALDPTEPADLRREATKAVVDLGDPKSRCALRSMALGQAGPDPDHHLRGIALNACWPDHLTTVELFGSLVPINKFGMGYYRSFLNGKWVSRLTADDMTHALAWVTGIQNLLRAGYDPYDGLEHKALDASLPYLDNPQILQSLVRAILSLIKNGDLNRHGDSPLANRVETDADLRHRMAEIALSILRPPDEHAWILTSGRMPLVCSQDIDWLVQKLIDTPDGPLRCAFADLIQRQHNLEGSSGVESLLLASEADSALVDLLPHWLAPVQLDSAQAKAYRHHYQRHLESERLQRSLSEPITPTRSERISSALASFEAGEVDAWCALCHILECDERGRFDSSGYTWDLRDLTGWKSVSVADEPRLIQAAERYLIKRTAQPERWFANTSSVPSFAFGGLHALAFLGGIAPGKFRALPVEVWIQWMPAILRVPNYGAQDQHQRVVDQAFQRAPTEAEHWTMKILEAVMVDGGGIEILEYIPYTLSPSLGLSLLSMARRGSVQPRLFRRLVRELWRRRVPGLQEWLVECLEIANAIEADHKERTLSICSVLVREGGCHEWPLVREMIRRSDDLGQKVFIELVHINSRTIPRILTGSPEQESAELWEWAMKHFPPSTYQPKRGSGQVTDSEQIGEFRNNLLYHLAKLGTRGACQALSRLAQAYPSERWIAQLLRRATAELRRNEWIPVDPRVLFQLPRNRRARLVQSEAQLMEVVLASLERAQECLQGENPLATLFWNDDSPKKEEEIAPWITQQLKGDLVKGGVVLDREVVISPTKRLDILVTAQAYDTKECRFYPLTLIIEIKRDINPGIDHSMQTQLDERYLTDNNCRTGLYLVAWFDSKHSRRTTRERLEARRESLAIQARKLSSPERHICSQVLDFSLETRPKSKKEASKLKGKVLRVRNPGAS